MSLAPESPPPVPPAPGGSPKRRLPWLVLALIVVGALAVSGAVTVRRARLHSQEESILCEVRQLSAAADQYFLENSVSTARFDQLVGSSNYLRAVQVVAGETYPDYYTQGMTITVRGVAGAATVTYAP